MKHNCMLKTAERHKFYHGLSALKFRRLSSCIACFVLLVAGTGISGVSSAAGDDAQISQAYFVVQAAGEALLIRINAFEAEFESKIFGPNREVLLVSALPGSRIAPVFQYVQAPQKSRQLDIELISSSHTDRSEYGIELTRLTVWDDRSNAVSQAYQFLSYGMQSGDAGSEANWTVKIDSLLNAGKLFQQFGMQEMRLWANYLAAHLVYFHLHDYSFVYSLTREILAEQKGAHLQKVELATLQLQSAALIGLTESGAMQTSASEPDPVQSVLARTAELAAAMAYQFEQARALSTSGARYANGSFYPQALEQFQRALEIADSVGDAELEKSIRENILAIHALQGDVPASSEVLQEIETQLADKGASDELALNLLAQGRLLIQHYRYNRAMEVLAQALTHQNDSSIRKQIDFELARVFYETGRLDDSMDYLELAGISPVSGHKKQTNSLLDYAEALQIMANIHRARHEHEQMRRARIAEGQYGPSRAHYLYEQGLDEIATPKKAVQQQAQNLFRQVHSAALVAGNGDLEHLSLLQYCALVNPGDSLCSGSSVTASYEWLLAGGVPRYAGEAMFLWAQILVKNGRHSEAIAVMDRLTSEIHFLRYSVPGALGSWYTERHEELFEYYLQLVITAPDPGGRAGDSASLLALSKIRLIESARAADTGPGDTDLLRTHLAQRSSSGPGQVLYDLTQEINQGLAQIRAPFKKQFSYLSEAGLQQFLDKLDSDASVLTYHISASSAHVWLAHRGKVQRLSLPDPSVLNASLLEAREGLAYLGLAAFENRMDKLGNDLLGPVADVLTDTIYWIPAGPLLGVPLDAIRLKGHYLAERHTLVNMLSFPANVNPAGSLQSGLLQKIFLAGHPQDYSGDYATRLDTSDEILAMADIFVGPGLHIVQGAALLPDEFQDERFRQANLVHLGMPGEIDLKYPERSSLELSEDEDGLRRTFFWPEDIQSQSLGASLVFLSATSISKQPISGFSCRLGLVTDFLDAGAHSVIAGFWSNGGKADQGLLTEFYRRLDTSGNIANALAEAKRQTLKINRENGIFDWAGYQVFIR